MCMYEYVTAMHGCSVPSGSRASVSSLGFLYWTPRLIKSMPFYAQEINAGGSKQDQNGMASGAEIGDSLVHDHRTS